MHDAAAESMRVALGGRTLMTLAAASIAKPLLGAALAVLVAAGCFMLMRKRARSAAPLPCAEALGNPPQSDEPAVVQLSPEQAIGAIADDSSWPAIALRARVQGCGGVVYADSQLTRMCHAASGGRLAFCDCRPRRA